MVRRDFVEHEDQNGRVFFSAIVPWQCARGWTHCLMQVVFLPGNQLKIFLAQLKTCPLFTGIFHEPENAANAAWRALEDHFGELSHLDVEWVFRGGEFSSYDIGIFSSPRSTLRYYLTRDSQCKWHYKEFDSIRLTTEEITQMVELTNLPEVEDDLKKLESSFI
jgi:hypothetical protein